MSFQITWFHRRSQAATESLKLARLASCFIPFNYLNQKICSLDDSSSYEDDRNILSAEGCCPGPLKRLWKNVVRKIHRRLEVWGLRKQSIETPTSASTSSLTPVPISTTEAQMKDIITRINKLMSRGQQSCVVREAVENVENKEKRLSKLTRQLKQEKPFIDQYGIEFKCDEIAKKAASDHHLEELIILMNSSPDVFIWNDPLSNPVFISLMKARTRRQVDLKHLVLVVKAFNRQRQRLGCASNLSPSMERLCVMWATDLTTDVSDEERQNAKELRRAYFDELTD